VTAPGWVRVDLEASVRAALAEVPDPEIPTVSVLDLGIVRSIEASPERIRVELLPTFIGCPAVELMRAAVAERLSGMAQEVDVEMTFAEPWTSERITPTGREKLRSSGFAPPQAPVDDGPALIPLRPVAECPFCGSRRTVMENAFGPTLCRSIFYCTECRQPFEQFKSV
jgi:ring-1,2-phenylacetyl-CoA epoxidase subunit PaaD